MSFWDDAVDFIGTYNPVTAVPKVFADVLNTTLPGNKYAGAIANTFAAPSDFLKGGKLSLSKANAAISQAAPGLQLAGSIANSGAFGAATGFDANGISMASGILHDLNPAQASGAVANRDRGSIVNEAPAYATPFKLPPGDNTVLYVGAAGAALLLGLLLWRK